MTVLTYPDLHPIARDAHLLTMVLKALARLPADLRGSHLPLDITVQDGVVTICGMLFEEQMRRPILEAVATVPGVRDTVIRPVCDRDLEAEVRKALAAERKLSAVLPTLQVSSDRGEITLRGQVRTMEQRSLALMHTYRVTGVRRVFNMLEIACLSRSCQ